MILLNYLIFTPLDQFDLIKLWNGGQFVSFDAYYTSIAWNQGSYNFNLLLGDFWSFVANQFFFSSLTNVTIFTFYILYLVNIVFYNYICYNEVLPQVYQIINENFILTVRSLLVENLGSADLVYFIYLFAIMVIILLSNFIGLVPFAFTVTSHLAITFAIAYISFFGLNVIGVLLHGTEFFSLFLPNGAPLMIAPFLVIIEIISYIARVFSLSIRLFANMMSGHTLLKILSSFSWNLFCMGTIGSLMFFIPSLIVVAVTGLESAIAFLQAYVFCILLCLYFHDAIHLH